jgi:hypothetical protein
MNRKIRKKKLENAINNIEEIEKFYKAIGSGWILVATANSHLKSLLFLEKSNFSEEILMIMDNKK